MPFNTDDAAICQLFFWLLEENRFLQFERIYADVVEMFGIDLKTYLMHDFSTPLSITTNQIVYEIGRNASGIEILTSRRYVEKLTDHYQVCKLAGGLGVNHAVNIGYGVGQEQLLLKEDQREYIELPVYSCRK